MNEAKEEILNRLGTALDKEPGRKQISEEDIARPYRQKGQLSSQQRLALFAERVGEYKAEVRRVNREELPARIAQSCQNQQVQKLVVPPDFPETWLPAEVHPFHDTAAAPLSYHELDASDGVMTCCALAVAQTGTIILDGGDAQGRRALTLLPDYHCVWSARSRSSNSCRRLLLILVTK